MLGPLEREVVAAVRRIGAGCTRTVLEELRRGGTDVAYTTVATILSRLHRKGFVERRREPFKGGDRFTYLYKDIEAEYIDSLLSGLVSTFGPPGVAHLARRIDGIVPDEVRRPRAQRRA